MIKVNKIRCDVCSKIENDAINASSKSSSIFAMLDLAPFWAPRMVPRFRTAFEKL